MRCIWKGVAIIGFWLGAPFLLASLGGFWIMNYAERKERECKRACT